MQVTPAYGGCASAQDAVRRQDSAFSSDGIDMRLWQTTVYFPLLMASEEYTIVLRAPEDLFAQLHELHKAARREGVVALRTDITSQHDVSDTMSILVSKRHRLGADGAVLASTQTTWTVVNDTDGWRVRMIMFEDRKGDQALTSLLPYRLGEI